MLCAKTWRVERVWCVDLQDERVEAEVVGWLLCSTSEASFDSLQPPVSYEDRNYQLDHLLVCRRSSGTVYSWRKEWRKDNHCLEDILRSLWQLVSDDMSPHILLKVLTRHATI